MTSIVVRDASTIIPFAGSGPLRAAEMSSTEIVDHSSLLIADGRVAGVGAPEAADIEFDATGCTIIPGFVDPHTHLPFVGWRGDEDAARLAGRHYRDLHREDGGIYRSARLLGDAQDEEVLAFSASLAAGMLAAGTTTFETKSGYGLSIASELRQLRLAARLKVLVPQTVVSTCLAAHAVPKGKSEGEWIGEVAQELLPVVAAEGLASACDIYVESIAFALDHAARLSETARSVGLRMRMHADQLEDSQAGAFAARWGFATADHLNHTSLEAVGDLAASETVAVLLPGATFTLRQNKKPLARNLIESGAIVALGTDLNPGTSPIHSMPFVIALACRTYGLRPIEALAASTVNAAYAVGVGDGIGRLAPGGRGDAAILDMESFDEIAYRPDRNPVLAVLCGGELVHVAPDARHRVAS